MKWKSFAFSRPLILFLGLGFDDNPRLSFEKATGGHLIIVRHGFVIEKAHFVGS
jgi:hypothetical protein